MKSLIIVLVLAVASTIAAFATARPQYRYATFYFSDGTKSELVGEEQTFCNGTPPLLDGIRTAYYDSHQELCGDAWKGYCDYYRHDVACSHAMLIQATVNRHLTNI